MKWLVFPALLIMLSFGVFAASVSRDMSARVGPGDSVTVVFNLASLEVGKTFTLEDDLPDSFSFVSWEVSGVDRASVNHRAAEGNRHGWSFNATQAAMQIKYVATAPSLSNAYDFDAVWFDSSGQSRDKKSMLVKAILCGDTVCEGNENNNLCPADCPLPQETTPLVGESESKPGGETEVEVRQEKPGNFNGVLVVAAIGAVVLAVFLLMRRKR
ncbi:hypothetical protein HYU11_02720 [Candidatus Woesearchaeota archaeon]|nr:hypothetical protein [Candidatus Woesearchaeota archaeon]